MKNKLFTFLTLIIGAAPLAGAQSLPGSGQTGASIPFAELGAKVGAEYQGDGLSVLPTPEGARLQCVFQKLEGDATPEGLWLVSTADDAIGNRFHVVATSVGREAQSSVEAEVTRLTSIFDFEFRISDFDSERPHVGSYSAVSKDPLPVTGTVSVVEKLARFARPGLVEEYSVSVDGVRQDFLILDRPEGEGKLRVELDVAGAKAEALVNGAQLALDGSGRKIAYSRLRAVDAQGRELAARMEVASANRLAVVVDDAAAAYPVRIDPTFSDADWVSMGDYPGANDSGTLPGVYAAVADGAGNLYIGGDFTVVGNALAKYVAKWDGSTWSGLGSGVQFGGGNPTVLSLAVSSTNLYVGGYFTSVGGIIATNIARWNGNSWSALGPGLNSFVGALAVSGTNVYAGGTFTMSGGSAIRYIARWNGSSWSALGSGLNDTVSALAISGTNLYVGGSFTTAGGAGANYIARWNGSSWSALGSGIGGSSFPWVSALAVSGTDLYVGGDFTTAGSAGANHIARWNGSAWSALGSGVNSNVYALAVSGTDLYAGGQFPTAKWNGSVWSTLGTGLNGDVHALAVLGTNLYAGGSFTTAGDVAAENLASWNGSSWSALGFGLGGPSFAGVTALAVSGTDLYVGGLFTTAGGLAVNNVVKWNGSGWSALGSGVTSPYAQAIYALAVSGTNLYAGGVFDTAGGVPVRNIAMWNGSEWSALGEGLYSGDIPSVNALAVSGTNLYVGGQFTVAGSSFVTNIAKWDGSAWSALGSGVGTEFDHVYALAVSGTNLYAAGHFGTAGGVAATNIARWNGSAWSALTQGVSKGLTPGFSSARALVVSGTNLYVGGTFVFAGFMRADSVAKWNGNAWSALGSAIPRMGGPVYALTVSGTNLYVGGNFTTAGGLPANNIAKWNDSAWSALGSGVNDQVNALLISGNDLYVSGDFSAAGGKVSTFLARAVIGPPSLTIAFTSTNTVMVSWPSPSTDFTLQQNTNLSTTNWVTPFETVNDNSSIKYIIVNPPSANRFYRLFRP